MNYSIITFSILMLLFFSSCHRPLGRETSSNSNATAATTEVFNPASKQILELHHPQDSSQIILFYENYTIDKNKYLVGNIENNGTQKKVTLNTSLIINLNNNTKRYTNYVAPFIVDDSEKEYKTYLGYFQYDNNFQTLKHTDSYFLDYLSLVQEIKNSYGNSIELVTSNVKQVTSPENKIKTYTVHYNDQGFIH